MQKMKSKKRILISFCIAVLFSVSVFGLQASAKFKAEKLLATVSRDTATVALKNEAAYAECPNLDTHFGDWSVGDVFTAELHFKSNGNTDVVPAAQLDIKGTDGNSYNTSFSGKYSVTAGSVSETNITWADEQTFYAEVPAGETGIVVKYELVVSTALPKGVSPVPEFSCAVIQKDNQPDNFRASCRAIENGTQTGFSAAVGKDQIHDKDGNLLKDTYKADSYQAKTFKFTVTPDDADTSTKVNIYKLDNTEDATTYKTAPKLVTDEVFTSARNYNIPFKARKGMNSVIIVDAENAKAGHRLYKYKITWPADGTLSYTRTELKLDGSALN